MWTDSRMTGYKWTRGKNDNINYIIKLKYLNDFPDPLYKDSFYTTDCIVESITDESGTEVDEIDGRAFADYVYVKGQRIVGEKIFFCKSMSDLERIIVPGGRPLAQITTERGIKLVLTGICLRFMLGKRKGE